MDRAMTDCVIRCSEIFRSKKRALKWIDKKLKSNSGISIDERGFYLRLQEHVTKYIPEWKLPFWLYVAEKIINRKR
jgi:hypothetical protein